MDDKIKKRIIKENLNLPPHEIKKVLKKTYPDVTNEEVEKLIISINNPDRIERQDNEENER